MATIKAAGKIVSCFMLVFLSTGMTPTEVPAGECDQVVTELKQIKGLIKRQSFLDEAVKECADNYLITYYYAYNFERRRKYDRARHYYLLAINLNPEYARSYFGLGDTYLALQKNKEAVVSFKKGLLLEPGNIWADKSLKKAKEELAKQTLQRVVAGNHEETLKEDKPVVLLFPAPEPLTSVKHVADEPKQEKDVTARDFIDRMRFDSAASRDVQNPVMRMQIQFNPSSGDLTTKAMEQLDSVVCKALQSDELKNSHFEVAGHTDSTGSFDINMHISRMRAHTVKKYLVESCGVEADRLNVVYYGETRPFVPNTSRGNRRLNRRVEFRRVM